MKKRITTGHNRSNCIIGVYGELAYPKRSEEITSFLVNNRDCTTRGNDFNTTYANFQANDLR